MGRGNWRPYQNAEIYELRYFDLYERFGVEDPEVWDQVFWEMFREEILEALPDSFYESKRVGEPQIPYTNFAQDNLVLFRNELVCVMMDASAEASHVGVAMVCLENYSDETWVENFAPSYMEREASKFFKRMGGAQSVRTSAWTSAKVTP
jgi:hypothetical protein